MNIRLRDILTGLRLWMELLLYPPVKPVFVAFRVSRYDGSQEPNYP